MLKFVIMIFCLSSVVLGHDPNDCFRRFGNCDIIYSEPYSKIWRVDSTECLLVCAQDQPKCKAVVYDSAFSICNMYPFTGNSGPGFLIPAFKKVYYQVNDTECLHDVTRAPTIATTPVVVVPGLPIPPEFPAGEITSTAAAPAAPPAVSARAVVHLGNKASVGSCPGDKQPVYLGLMETSVVTPSDIDDGPTLSNIGDPSTCISACTQNQEPNGKSMDCDSFTYNSVNQKCTFHPFNPKPEGPAATTTVVGMNTFVKSCVSVIPENIKCKNAMLVTVPRVELLGHVRKSLGNIKSMAACLERCLTDSPCKSFNYYPKNKKCTLHDTDSLATPDAITVARSADAIYVENSCGGGSSRRQLAHVDPAAVNRFETPPATTPNATDAPVLDIPKKEKSSKPKKISLKKLAIKTDDHETKLTSWGEWTECLEKAHGLNVRVRVRSCKEDKVVCKGTKAEYEKCE